MIVADTNIISYTFIKSNLTEKCFELLKKDPDWISPLLWKSEFRNVLMQHIRFNSLDLQTAIEIMTIAENFMKSNEYEIESKDVLELITSSKASAYDCEFIALAKKFNIKLITTDNKLIGSFPDTAIHLNEF
ncbi:MAG: type II toxin-antitoxin system VapC family toxin [Bacteroidetes bacterium]|nr:type II toxin-antitoxin system VapC family toxin [Bacteroidota bacterium]